MAVVAMSCPYEGQSFTKVPGYDGHGCPACGGIRAYGHTLMQDPYPGAFYRLANVVVRVVDRFEMSDTLRFMRMDGSTAEVSVKAFVSFFTPHNRPSALERIALG